MHDNTTFELPDYSLLPMEDGSYDPNDICIEIEEGEREREECIAQFKYCSSNLTKYLNYLNNSSDNTFKDLMNFELLIDYSFNEYENFITLLANTTEKQQEHLLFLSANGWNNIEEFTKFLKSAIKTSSEEGSTFYLKVFLEGGHRQAISIIVENGNTEILLIDCYSKLNPKNESMVSPLIFQCKSNIKDPNIKYFYALPYVQKDMTTCGIYALTTVKQLSIDLHKDIIAQMKDKRCSSNPMLIPAKVMKNSGFVFKDENVTGQRIHHKNGTVETLGEYQKRHAKVLPGYDELKHKATTKYYNFSIFKKLVKVLDNSIKFLEQNDEVVINLKREAMQSLELERFRVKR